MDVITAPPRPIAPARPFRDAVRRTSQVALVVVAFSVGTGCGDGDAAADPDDIGVAARSEAPGADADEVRAAVEGLLAERDRLAIAIGAEPSQVSSDSEAVSGFLALYEPDSPDAAGALAAWAEMAAAGRHTVPADAGHPPFAARLDGDIEHVSDVEVRFPTCNEQRYAVVDADARPVELQPYAEVPGEGVAVLVDGEWRLRELTVQAATGCREDQP